MRFALRVAAFVLLAGCAELPDIQNNVCGNAVLEPDADEDCDVFVDQAETPGAVCRPKGAEGQCHFDCQLVEGKRSPCPSGMACGSDGLCRHLTEQLDTKVKLSSDVASWLSELDFDGDGRAELVSTEPVDLLQQARFRLHYLDHDGEVEETRTFPRITTRPIAYELDDEPGDDLLFSNLQVGMVFGRPDREWVPEALSSYVVPNDGLRAVSVRSDLVSGEIALVAFTTLSKVRGLFVPNVGNSEPGGGQLVLRAELSRPLTDLVGEPIAADLITGVDSPCDEVAFAFRGERSFRVLDMCQVGDPGSPLKEVVWRSRALERTVRLPPDEVIDAGPLAADVNADGHLDLLIGGKTGTFVAYGDGSSLSEIAEPLEVPVYQDGVPDTKLWRFGLPLAAGDITGDGWADFVLPDFVLASRVALDGSLGYLLSFVNNAQPWTMAKLSDLNGNGLPDLVAASAGALGVTFLNGTGGPYQVAARLGSHSALRFLTTGDFDGDRIGDTAFVEDDPVSPGVGVLSVAFGQRDGVPLPATRIAKLTGVTQLSRFHEEGLDALMAASLTTSRGVQHGALTLFDGSPDRLPFAPYSLVPFTSDLRLGEELAMALSVGAFTSPKARDVVILGMPQEPTSWDLWLLPNAGTQSQPPLRLAFTPPSGTLPRRHGSRVFRLAAAPGAGDLDGDGDDESLWLMPSWEGATVVGCKLLGYDIAGGSFDVHERLQLGFGEHCSKPELVVRDLDGDQAVDLVLLMGDPATGRRVRILWNDGSGGFANEASTDIAAPVSRDAAPLDLRSIAVLPGEPSRLALLAPSSLYLATLRGREVRRMLEVPDFIEAQAVTALDVNADGVHEVVVADAQGIWLLPRQLR